MQATVIRHVAFEDLGNLGSVLSRRGYRVDYCEAGLARLEEIDPEEADLFVVLGGPISANQVDDYPFLAAEVELLRARLVRDLPTLGICLGAQLMARALGASVVPGPAKEIGWSRIELTSDGRRSPLRFLEGPVLHWHGETFQLPREATRLASTSACPNQAMQIGRRGLGLQFHPEVTERGLERWLIGHALEIETTPGLGVAGLRQATRRNAAGLQEAAEVFWNAWLDSVE